MRDHRQQAAAAQIRFLALMEANRNGELYRAMADALAVSIGMIQQCMAAAPRHLDAG